MRLISFGLTEQAILDRQKDVTRRLGWKHIRPGDRLRGVHKAMGLRKGERPRTLAVVEVVSVRRERLDAITDDDVRREGFPDAPSLVPGAAASWFVGMFCKAMGCRPEDEVTRIEFRYVEEDTP